MALVLKRYSAYIVKRDGVRYTDISVQEEGQTMGTYRDPAGGHQLFKRRFGGEKAASLQDRAIQREWVRQLFSVAISD